MLAPLLANFLKFEGKSTFPSLETILFIREVIEVHPEHRSEIFNKICSNFQDIRSHLVIRVALWILGEYAETTDEVNSAFATIKRNLGSLPIFAPIETNATEEEKKSEETKGPQIVTKTVILADGSYGTQTTVIDDKSKIQDSDECSYLPLRNALVTADDEYLASCLAVTLTKLVLRSKARLSLTYKSLSVDAILVMCAILKDRQSKGTDGQSRLRKTDRDSLQRVQFCLRVLSKPQGQNQAKVDALLLEHGKAIFKTFLQTNSKLQPGRDQSKSEMLVTQPDESIAYRQLKPQGKASDFDITEETSGGIASALASQEESSE